MDKILSAGILAHVDAGKTTLSEALLYQSGMIRNLGRVDKGNAYLDNDTLERERGITIFSKEALLQLPGCMLTLLDTPGHVDFSGEMERTLSVLDYAILVVNGGESVCGRTKTLWGLLKKYHVPVFLFVNKMDMVQADREKLYHDLKEELSDNCIMFDTKRDESFYEDVATGSEEALEEFLSLGKVKEETICRLIEERQIFPCYFGSALKMQGVDTFLQGFLQYTKEPDRGSEFGARVFKIARKEGERLTYIKVTSGSLKVRELLKHPNGETEKVSQIRIYSGEKFKVQEAVSAGMVCALLGLQNSFEGECFGVEEGSYLPVLVPVLSYRINLPEGTNPLQMLPKLRELEEEDPLLHIRWREEHQEISAWVMGEVQIEVLKRVIFQRFGVEVDFSQGSILYKETIADTVEGVGHFEPLRHYAEVHLLMEPGEPGSGLTFHTDCSQDILDKNWQRLICTHLKEKEHAGVLTGSPITDMKITVVSGRAHQKHTEGGDFRQATYRAVRQGLAQAECLLLEPYYEYRLEVPDYAVGRAMTDIEKMHGTINPPEHQGNRAVLKGIAPVACMGSYGREAAVYTRGEARLSFQFGGYHECHNTEEVVKEIGYEFEHDTQNPASSVFCAHGAGFVVEWDEVFSYMHMPSVLEEKVGASDTDSMTGRGGIRAQGIKNSRGTEEKWMATEEVDAILERTLNANKRDKSLSQKKFKTKHVVTASSPSGSYKVKEVKERYLLVDGYNIIFAWEELSGLAKINIDGARGRLLDILCDYQAMEQCNLIVVFDAYRVEGHKTEIFDYHNIHVVFTKEAETADAYIEKFAHEHGRKYHVTVATSDGLEQVIIRGQGCYLLSAREFEEEVTGKKRQTEEYINPKVYKPSGFDGVLREELKKIKGDFI